MLALAPGIWCAAVTAAELNVAVAANFAATLRVLAPEFQRSTGDTLNISVASSGKLSAQIIHGAPYDVFLSADREHPQRLIDTNMALPDSLFTYALGSLVLWRANDTPVEGGMADTAAFRADNLSAARLIALASPRHAPYGKAAKETLLALGYWQNLMDNQRLAIAESVGQAWHFGASGNADLAFVALSQIKTAAGHNGRQISYWPVPAELYSPIVQQGIIVKASRQVSLARRFCSWLQADPRARATITEAGYGLRSANRREGRP